MSKNVDLNNNNLGFEDFEMSEARPGPKSGAPTPSTPSEKKKGSSKNKPGSAGKDGAAISKHIVIGNEFLIFNFLYMLFPFVSFLLGNECIEKIFIYKGTLIKIKNFAIG